VSRSPLEYKSETLPLESNFLCHDIFIGESLTDKWKNMNY
jgi:hypothetical protein